jgi:putative Holliday junction resolvase
MRLLAIDYGTKRTGLAVSDPLQIIATALQTVPTDELLIFLKNYCQNEKVEAFLVGKPIGLDGKPTEIAQSLEAFVVKLKNQFPSIKIHRIDERFTSVMAERVLNQSGKTRSSKREKGQIDKIAATLMLQEFMSNQIKPDPKPNSQTT